MLEISDTFTPEQTDTSPRLSVCLDAVYELDALARALPGLMPIDERGQAHLVTRGIAARMLRLTKSLLDGLTDDSVPTAELSKVVLLEGETAQG